VVDALYIGTPALGFLACLLAVRSRIGEIGRFVVVLVLYIDIFLLGKALVDENFQYVPWPAVGLMALGLLVLVTRARRAPPYALASSMRVHRAAGSSFVGSLALLGLTVVEVVIGAVVGIARELQDPLAFSGATHPQPSSGLENVLFAAAKPTALVAGGCALFTILLYGYSAYQAVRWLKRDDVTRL